MSIVEHFFLNQYVIALHLINFWFQLWSFFYSQIHFYQYFLALKLKFCLVPFFNTDTPSFRQLSTFHQFKGKFCFAFL